MNENETITAEQSDLNAFIDMAKEVAESNEDIERLRKSTERTEEERQNFSIEGSIDMDNLPEGVIAVNKEFNMDASGKPIFVKDAEGIPSASIPIDKIDELDRFNDNEFKKNFMENTKTIHNISDDAAIGLLDVLTAYRRDKSINVYSKLPDEIKEQVKEICMAANVPVENRGMVARAMLDQMIAETATDQTFIDFEKSINEAMKIPSLVDMYEEHIAETVGEKLPAMADAIKEEDPAKAKMLLDVANQYEAARTYSKLKECFDTNSRVRKLVRRDADRWHRFGEELNFMNKDSKFRMPDACSLHPILLKVIANDPDNDLTEENVNKFLVLLYRSCSNLHKDELVDASYIYYLLKNISMLNYVNDHSSKAADTFSVELISNIKAMMYYIMAKEEEFYASNKSSGSRK